MKYFEEMKDKFGFGDGDDVPEGVAEYREVYCRAVNAAAEKLGSNVRIVELNGSGLHNWCQIYRIDKKMYDDFLATGSLLLPEREEPEDETFKKAVEVCMETGLDEVIKFDARINEMELNWIIEKIKQE